VPSYEFAANPAAKDENFKLLRLRHTIFSVCEVHYLLAKWRDSKTEAVEAAGQRLQPTSEQPGTCY
jgi:hypothetical protein